MTSSRIVASTLYRVFALLRKFGRSLPYYAPPATLHLRRAWVGRPVRVFEWGSGESTVWYARWAAESVAVEHDRGWWERVARQLGVEEPSASRCLYIPPLDPEDAAAIDWARDWPYFDELGGPPGKPEFKRYMEAIDGFPDDYFDIVSVDGRERAGCIAHARRKVKPGGALVLDDSHRARYGRGIELLRDWPRRTFRAGSHETSVFRRPHEAG